MQYLMATVAFVGVLCLLDLVLTLGVLRRLRDHSEALDLLRSQPVADSRLGVGERAGSFSAVSTTGVTVTGEVPASRLVGFFAPGCQPCEEQLPTFMAYAVGFPGEVLAVVASDGRKSYPIGAELAEVGAVVHEPGNGPVHQAYRVSGYPSMYLVDGDGIVQATGSAVSALPAAAPA
jgi:hypothetical protein